MATSSEVKTGLDEISGVIREQRNAMAKVISNSSNASAELAALATTYADVVSEVNAYGTSNAFEAHAKAELAKLVTEYTALKAIADQVAALDLG